MRRAAVILLLFALAACSSGRSTPTGSPRSSTTPTAAPRKTIDAPKADVETLVRPHDVGRTAYGDMDGDGTDEVAVWSLATEAPGGSVLRQSYIDVFAFRGGTWKKVFAATKEGVLNENPNDVSQDVADLTFIDFRGESKPYLTLGIQSVGAGNGPLDVWALRWDGRSAFDKEFHYATERGGTLIRQLTSLTLETGSYKPGDPGCCPRAMADILIGYKDGKVQVISRTETPTSPQP